LLTGPPSEKDAASWLLRRCGGERAAGYGTGAISPASPSIGAILPERGRPLFAFLKWLRWQTRVGGGIGK